MIDKATFKAVNRFVKNFLPVGTDGKALNNINVRQVEADIDEFIAMAKHLLRGKYGEP